MKIIWHDSRTEKIITGGKIIKANRQSLPWLLPAFILALALTMSDSPIAVNMSFQREYSERYDWLKQQFIDWAFNASSVFLYYNDKDALNDDSKALMRQSIAAFGGNAPTYHIELSEQPMLVWDFHSLLLGIQMMLSFMLTSDRNPLRICKNCSEFFIANKPGNEFCSPKCKNKYNAYKNRDNNSSY